MHQSSNNSFKDVNQYPDNLLRMLENGVALPATYKNSWDDGFCARGWKLDAAIGDPDIIASTSETGERIDTSVFVHDILDHFLSGFGISGHRSEAMALIQLSERTHSDPTPDYEQMIQEDILNGRVNGESLIAFLPAQLGAALPSNTGMDDKEFILALKRKFSEGELRGILVKHFFELGQAGKEHAIKSWLAVGLNPGKRTEIGLALQKLLEIIDARIAVLQTEELKGYFILDNKNISFVPRGGNSPGAFESASTAVT